MISSIFDYSVPELVKSQIKDKFGLTTDEVIFNLKYNTDNFMEIAQRIFSDSLEDYFGVMVDCKDEYYSFWQQEFEKHNIL